MKKVFAHLETGKWNFLEHVFTLTPKLFWDSNWPRIELFEYPLLSKNRIPQKCSPLCEKNSSLFKYWFSMRTYELFYIKKKCFINFFLEEYWIFTLFLWEKLHQSIHNELLIPIKMRKTYNWIPIKRLEDLHIFKDLNLKVYSSHQDQNRCISNQRKSQEGIFSLKGYSPTIYRKEGFE